MCIESNVDVTGGKELEIDHRQKLDGVNEKTEDFQAQSEDREGKEGTFQYIIKTSLVDFTYTHCSGT